jgi:sugar/nucleoside kinase (ribokinase family)
MSVLVVGDVVTDIIAIPEGPIVRGSDRRAKIRSRPGGSAANLAVWLGSLGAAVTFAARVAAVDVESWSAYFRSRRVAPILAADPDLPSGVLISIVDVDGERSFLTDRGANLNLNAQDLPAAVLDGVSVLAVSGYSYFADRPRDAVMGLMKAARERKIRTIVDPASVGFLREVGAETFLRWTQGTGTIFANTDEALELTGSSDPNLQMQTLGRFYDSVVLKRGAAGAALGGRKGVTISLPAPVTAVVDSTGAGDAFAAGYIAAGLAGGTTEDCLRAGIDAGAKAVAIIGGQPDGQR